MFRDNLNKSHLQNEQPTFSLNESWYFEFLRRSCPSGDDRYVEEKNEPCISIVTKRNIHLYVSSFVFPGGQVYSTNTHMSSLGR